MGVKISNGGNGRFGLGQNADINVTPFVDVLLVLLIIFMLAVPMATVSVKVDFPPGVPSTGKSLVVSVAQHGQIYLDSREVTLASLNTELARALGVARPTDERITIRADRDVEYHDFMQVMNTLKQGGYSKIGMITEIL